jgi:hypothetical protein
MGLLDKLKPQPRWKHADPVVRLEALRELDDQVELAGLAEADADAKVRRAAIQRLGDPATLGRIASGHADAETRERASERLLALATASDGDVATAVAAIEQMSDARQLSTIAKSDAAEAVRAAALARTTDERALGAIARGATHESSALAALDRLTDAAELLAVALESSHKDTALRAFDRAIAPSRDLAQLRSVESRAGQKAVAKRAKAIIQEIEAAEAARRAAEDERRHREALLCADVERLADVEDAAAARSELLRLTESWAALEVTDADTRARFARGVSEAQAAIVRREREAEEAAERARVRAEALASREALCVRVETLSGDHMLEHLAPIEEEWGSLTPLVGNGPEADRLAERFVVAVAACRRRHELSGVLVETGAKLEALVVEAEGLLSLDDTAAALARWQTLSREARGYSALLAESGKFELRSSNFELEQEESAARPGMLDRLASVDQAFAAREAAKRDAAVKAQQDLVVRLQRLTERAKRAAEADQVTLREGERLMRDIGAALDEMGRTKTTREMDEAVDRLRAVQQTLAPRVRELRDMDEWRRFANAQQQEQLIAMAEAIVLSLKNEDETGKPSDLPATARALKELHAKWQEVADAPRQHAQRLWDRFRSATDFIRTRCESYFAKLRDDLVVNLEKKTAIVTEAEALANSSDWGKVAAKFQELQTAWLAVGPVPRHAARDLPHRFRTACNLFFSRRRDDLLTRKKVWGDNLSRKEALCERAETLAESTDWEAASSEMKRLQADWKTIGPVRKAKSEVVWARFRAAADKFFERFHHRHEITIATKLAEREALVVELESLAAAGDDVPAADVRTRVEAVKTTWVRSVPIPPNMLAPMAERWRVAFAAVLERRPDAFQGTDFDPSVVQQRMEKLVAKVEALVGSTREQVDTRSQTELLAAKLRSAFATNAMGGRVNEEGKWRAATEAVKDAQASWQRLVLPATAEARSLEHRFKDACRKIMEQAKRHAGQSGPPRQAPKQTTGAMA